MTDDVVDVQINGHVVAELHQIGETERRHRDAAFMQGIQAISQQRQFRISGGNEHHIAGALPEIDGFLAVTDGARLCR
jgi:oligoribonuclease NrnB/cAMP/cGMP phosphodiesterase (DHH superfamily)